MKVSLNCAQKTSILGGCLWQAAKLSSPNIARDKYKSCNFHFHGLIVTNPTHNGLL